MEVTHPLTRTGRIRATALTARRSAGPLSDYGRAGTNEVVADVAGVYAEHGQPDAVRDLRDILTACREAANRFTTR